jgi:hypothetical protein
VYEVNKSQIIAKEESFNKNLESNDVTAQENLVETQSYSEREPSIRASELKSDFRTSRSSKVLKPCESEASLEETVYSKEESFNKMTPSRLSTLDHAALQIEFQKNGVINISDYLDSNKDREFNR